MSDWLADTLVVTRKLLAALPAEKKAALENDAKFQEAVRANEQAELVGRYP